MAYLNKLQQKFDSTTTIENAEFKRKKKNLLPKFCC